MKKSNIVWGVICLVIAAGLAVANLTLPPEDLMFQIGDINAPWVPPVVLAIIGIILLSTASQSEEATPAMAGEADPSVPTVDPEREALNKRFETVAWGAFLIMLGGFMFVPEEIIKGGWWSIGVGVIMLGLNGARYANGLRMSGFTTFVGIISVIGGVLDLLGVVGVDGAIFLIILGGYLLLKPFFDRQQLFGKAEHSR